MKRYGKWRQSIGYLWLLPALILILIFCVYPPIVAAIRSFYDWTPSISNFIGFGNYKEILTDSTFWISMKNMGILVVAGIVFGNIATLLLAEFIFNLRGKRAAGIYRFFFILPVLVPGMVTMLLWRNIIFEGSDLGLVNSVLQVFSIGPYGWYAQKETALIAIIFTNFPWVAGTSFLIYFAGLQNISDSVIEASKIDGLGTWGRAFKIDLPLILPQLQYFLIIGIINGVQIFDIQMLFTQGGPDNATVVPGYVIFTNTIAYNRYGYASAMGMLLFVITLIFTVLSNRISRRQNAGGVV